MHASSEINVAEETQESAGPYTKEPVIPIGYCAGCMRNRAHFDKEIEALRSELHRIKTRGQDE